MEFVKQYLRIISYLCSGLVFAFASFYLLANLYHYYELRKDYVVNFDNQVLVKQMDKMLTDTNTNIQMVDLSNYNGKVSTMNMMLVKNNLNTCIENFNNPTFSSLRGKNRITILDVYNLRESYENYILNNCIISNLYWLSMVNQNFGSDYLVNNQELIKLYINTLLSSTAYLKKDLLNNSSYYYNTAIASSSMLDNTRDGFNEVMDAYNRAADFVLYLSNWYRMEAGY